MQCDNCHERPAAIHLTQIVDNSVTTAHLCEECASEKGINTSASVAKLPLAGFLGGTGTGVAAALPAGADAGACDSCGSTLQDFRDTGRLGCAHCYAQFEPQLRELLRRIHGSFHHVGKLYLHGETTAADEVPKLLVELRDRLKRSIEAENFELAAELRDRIRALE
ncbi:MAG: UvrB/UvrC motif-containing protein [Gemmatimonadota bacterium]|nr:UvrB/UvrC motif-containing protein [Gemmatimonadota bacterium]MDH3369633.1 UvrB/UvrC motif-containing protein [Gemmatimonadota bacterium]MDH3477098.1 UvrB/UvrC motif-containing protein [Gemmatimonadota bacterium]MDH3568783.1 UvrB/UvrC motif-containing protein [Gemmatimonadota bacterium]MDH5550566.1 UvrB/UvrC motif-containing protein [Gemmatimonadota bacterium]